MKQSALSLVVAAVALLFASGIAVRVVADADWDVTVLAAFGEDDHSTRTYAEERLGEVFLRSDLGHDGRFFFVQSNDPWVTDPAENIDVVDRPLYRSQRMLYPVLAGGGGLLNAEAIIWSMIIVNVIAMGLGSWAVAQVAIEMGGSPWWGLAFVLNIGFISEMTIGAAGVVAGAAAFGSVALWMKDRTGWAVTLLTLSGLSREALLVAAFGTSWYVWKRGERRQARADLQRPGPAHARAAGRGGMPAGGQPVRRGQRGTPGPGQVFLDLAMGFDRLRRHGAAVDDGDFGPHRGRFQPITAGNDAVTQGLAHIAPGLG